MRTIDLRSDDAKGEQELIPFSRSLVRMMDTRPIYFGGELVDPVRLVYLGSRPRRQRPPPFCFPFYFHFNPSAGDIAMLRTILVAAIPLLILFLVHKIRYSRTTQYADFPQLPRSLLWGHLKALNEVIKSSKPNLHIGN